MYEYQRYSSIFLVDRSIRNRCCSFSRRLASRHQSTASKLHAEVQRQQGAPEELPVRTITASPDTALSEIYRSTCSYSSSRADGKTRKSRLASVISSSTPVALGWFCGHSIQLSASSFLQSPSVRHRFRLWCAQVPLASFVQLVGTKLQHVVQQYVSGQKSTCLLKAIGKKSGMGCWLSTRLRASSFLKNYKIQKFGKNTMFFSLFSA